MKKVGGWGCVMALVSSLLLAAVPAQARPYDGIKILGRDNPMVQRKYPGVTPAPRQGTGTVNMTFCAQSTVTFCDTIRMDADPQEAYALYSLRVVLSWPNAKTKDNPNGADLTLGIWEPNADPTSGRVAWTGANTDVHPEVLEFGQDNQDPQTFFIVVNGVAGAPNSEYSLRVEFAPTDLGELPEGALRARRGTSSGGTETTAARRSTALAVGRLDEAEPSPSPSPLKVPGADGELVEMDVPVYARGATAQQGVSPIVPITIGIVFLGAAIAAFLFIRSRIRSRRLIPAT